MSQTAQRKKDILIAGTCGAVVAAMVGAAYAAVPFYNWFCRTTGFGGTPQIATIEPAHAIARKVTVRFDANIAGGLPWLFEPEQNSIELNIGQVVTVDYLVINQSARETAGLASYNVSPPTVGAYFTKINCFCFSEQRLKPGEKRHMSVVFFVDPKIVEDWNRTISIPLRSPIRCIRLGTHRNRSARAEPCQAPARHCRA